ncbi:unnamed protein product [Didymodactylos carnosus]|nr:unnamed protein product [Didymodactylos carnosus]CAF3970535.1 unnamed protein product [Didymodactylos carnosus]
MAPRTCNDRQSQQSDNTRGPSSSKRVSLDSSTSGFDQQQMEACQAKKDISPRRLNASHATARPASPHLARLSHVPRRSLQYDSMGSELTAYRSSNTNISTAIAQDSDFSSYGVIILGNSGVGKSLLANILLKEEIFEHGCDAGSVTHETEYAEMQVGNQWLTIYNIPGLVEADQKNIDSNKKEIYKAFQKSPTAYVIFVFGGGAGGRIKDEDILAFELINTAYGFDEKSIVVVVNDLPSHLPEHYQGETTIKIQDLLGMTSLNVCFLPRINTSDEQSVANIRVRLALAIKKCRPKTYKKLCDIKLNVDELKRLKAEYKEKQKESLVRITQCQEAIHEKQEEFERYKQEQELVMPRYQIYERVEKERKQGLQKRTVMNSDDERTRDEQKLNQLLKQQEVIGAKIQSISVKLDRHPERRLNHLLASSSQLLYPSFDDTCMIANIRL